MLACSGSKVAHQAEQWALRPSLLAAAASWRLFSGEEVNHVALFCTELGRFCLCVIVCSGCAFVFCVRYCVYAGSSEPAARLVLGPQSGACRALFEHDVLGREVFATK